MKLIQNVNFKSVEDYDRNLFLVQMAPSKIRYDSPMQIAHCVYQYAKLNLLRFVYDFLLKYVPRDMVNILYCDTDSLYGAYGGDSLEDCVPSHLKRDFYGDYRQFFPSETCPAHWDSYVAFKLGEGGPVPHDCPDCVETRAYQRRTPGLYKLEFSGSEFVGLNSKSYWVQGEGDESKHSAKGCQKRTHLRLDNYKKVLETGESHVVENMGFKSSRGTMFTYRQEKHGLTPFYIKRRVLADGISTATLDI